MQQETETMPEVIESILREHRTIRQVLEVLQAQIDLFERAEQPDYELIREIIDYFRTFADLCHHPKEDLILHRLKTRDIASAQPFENLEALHEVISERLGDFSRAISRVMMGVEVPREALVSLARDFISGEHAHMDAEEEHFFPTAEQKLSPADWSDIDKIVADFRDPLLAPPATNRFQLLREHISNWNSAAA